MMTGGFWLGIALLTPLVMLAACLSGRMRDHLAVLLAAAPVPALMVAVLVPEGTRLAVPGTFGMTLLLDRPGALLLGASSLLWIAAAFAAARFLRGHPGADPLCGMVASHPDRQPWRLRRSRPHHLLSRVHHCQPCGLWAGGFQRRGEHAPCRLDLCRGSLAGRGVSPAGVCPAGSRGAGPKPADRRRRVGPCCLTLARCRDSFARPRVWPQDRPGAIACLDAAHLCRRTVSGGRGLERRGIEGGRDRPHPLPAARYRPSGLGRDC